MLNALVAAFSALGAKDVALGVLIMQGDRFAIAVCAAIRLGVQISNICIYSASRRQAPNMHARL